MRYAPLRTIPVSTRSGIIRPGPGRRIMASALTTCCCRRRRPTGFRASASTSMCGPGRSLRTTCRCGPSSIYRRTSGASARRLTRHIAALEQDRAERGFGAALPFVRGKLEPARRLVHVARLAIEVKLAELVLGIGVAEIARRVAEHFPRTRRIGLDLGV